MLTVSVVPVSVTGCSWLLAGHWAAVQLLFAASMKCPMPGLLGLTVNSCAPLAPSLKMKLGHCPTTTLGSRRTAGREPDVISPRLGNRYS